MPQGVEHHTADELGSAMVMVRIPLMPQGVEHDGDPARITEQCK